MNLKLTPKQYQHLLRLCDVGSSVFGILVDNVSEDYRAPYDQTKELTDHLLGHAAEFESEHLTQRFHGELMMSEDFYEEIELIMDDYDDETFWHELETRLGKRDFERTITPAEEKEIADNGGWLPKRIQGLYDKYTAEFEEFGIDRLELVAPESGGGVKSWWI